MMRITFLPINSDANHKVTSVCVCVCVHIIIVCVIRVMTVMQLHKHQGGNETEENQCMRGRVSEERQDWSIVYREDQQQE